MHTGVKSFGCEKSTAHESPIQSWNEIRPSVVSASKSGAVSPIVSVIPSSWLENPPPRREPALVPEEPPGSSILPNLKRPARQRRRRALRKAFGGVTRSHVRPLAATRVTVARYVPMEAGRANVIRPVVVRPAARA